MKKKDWFYIAAIGAVVICIIAVIVYKFVLPGKNQLDGFAVRDFEKITVMDLSGNKLQLSDMVSKDSSTYCFLFELTGCYSCISRGIADLKQLKAAGKPYIALAVHQTDTADYACGNTGSINNRSCKEFRKSPTSSGAFGKWSVWSDMLVSGVPIYRLRLRDNYT